MSYPSETTLTAEEIVVIKKIRDEIGDYLGVKRDYYDGSKYSASIGTTIGDNDSWARTSSNGKVYELEEKGWPFSITVNSSEYTTLTDPVVYSYRYLTFSGSVFTVTGTIDVFYNTFRFSDNDILTSYDRIDYIPGTAFITDITLIPPSWYYLYAAIRLLEGEFQQDATKSASVGDGDTRFDNQASMAVRQRELDALRKRLADEIAEKKKAFMADVTGVRVD